MKPSGAALWGLLFALCSCGPHPSDWPLVRPDACAFDCPPPSSLDGEPADSSDAAEERDAARRDGGDAADGAADPFANWDTAGAGPLTGTWAVRVTVHARVVIELESTQIYRMLLVQRGRDVRLGIQLCALQLPSVEGAAELIVPPALMDFLRSRTVELEGTFLSRDAPVGGASLDPPPALFVAGAALDDPEHDPLPSADDLDRAVDDDGDGHPGVTIEAKVLTCEATAQVYVALRTGATLHGEVAGGDAISGQADVWLDQSVLGVSDDCVAPAANIRVDIVPGSTFEARRAPSSWDVDGDGRIDCTELQGGAASDLGW